MTTNGMDQWDTKLVQWFSCLETIFSALGNKFVAQKHLTFTKH